MGETVLLALTPPESEAAEEACLRLSKRGPVNLSLGGLFPDNSGIPFTAARGGDLVLSLDSRWVHRFLQLIPDSAGGRTLEARLREAAASNGPRRLRSSEISDPGWYRANPVAPVGHGAVRKPVRVYEVRLLPESAWPVCDFAGPEGRRGQLLPVTAPAFQEYEWFGPFKTEAEAGGAMP